MKSSLFSEQNNYGRLNAEKYNNDMSGLSDINVEISNTLAIDNLMEFKELPLIFAIMMLFLIVVFVEEKDKGMITLIRTGTKGRGRLALKRCSILAFFSFVYTFIFNAIIFSIYLYVYGGRADFGNAIQSSNLFTMFPLKVNIIQFFYLYCIIFSVAMFTIGVIAYAFVCSFRNYKIALMALLLVLLVEFIIYKNVEPNSALCIFKYINLMNILLPGGSYLIYENWGYNGFITDISESTFIMTGFIAVLCFFTVVLINCFMYSDRKKGALDKLYEKLVRAWQNILSKSSSLIMELYKTLITQRGIVILLLAVYLLINCNIGRGVIYKDDFYIIHFYEQFSGKLPDESCTRYLEQFQSEIDELSAKKNIDHWDQKSIDDMTKAYQVMDNAVNYARQIQNEKGIHAVIVKPNTYNDIFGTRLYSNQENMNLICIFAIILMISGDFAYERKTGMYGLGRIVKRRNLTWLNKTVKVIVIDILVWGISIVINWGNITSFYQLNDLSVPIQSLTSFSDFPLRLSILGYIILCQLVRLLMLFMISLIVYGISFYTYYKKSIAISVMLLIPHLLYLFDIPFMEYISTVIPLDFNRHFMMFRGNMTGLILPCIIMGTGILIYFRTLKKWGES
jgi:hypothetical protein